MRKLIADAIERRDGHPCNPEDLYMTDGASPGVHYMMDLFIRDGRNDAIMVPIPQVRVGWWSVGCRQAGYCTTAFLVSYLCGFPKQV